MAKIEEVKINKKVKGEVKQNGSNAETSFVPQKQTTKKAKTNLSEIKKQDITTSNNNETSSVNLEEIKVNDLINHETPAELTKTEVLEKNKLNKSEFKEAVKKVKKEKKQFVKLAKQNAKKLIEPKVYKARKSIDIEKAKRFIVNPEIGLNKEQVKKRYSEGLYNKNKIKTTKSFFSIIFGSTFTFFNLLAVICAAGFIYAQSWKSLAFAAIFVANIIIQITQEIRAKLTVEKITLLTHAQADVIRDGKLIQIQTTDIVLDDIVCLSLGNQISADCIITSGSIEVNESLLTGESVPIKKGAGETLYAGSFVVAGKCQAKVEKVGDFNYGSSLVKKAQEKGKPKSELLRSINLIIRIIGFLVIPIGALTFGLTYKNTGLAGLVENIKGTAGSMILMVPAGMYLSISIALAVGVINLARKRTHIQNVYAIEMLSRVGVLCLDKTGTITDGTMKVSNVIELEHGHHNIKTIMGNMTSALNENNHTALALADYFGYNKDFEVLNTIAFSSARKFSAASFKVGEKAETFVMGAPEFILKKQEKSMEKLIKQFSEQGFRVLLLANIKGKIEKEKLPTGAINSLALIVIEDHIRETAAQTIRWFNENGVAVKIISGDNPVTVSEIARRVGVQNADKYISLEGLTKQQVVDVAGQYAVFGRVTPEQKAILIKALKNKGKKVAMTGDGVNDILALKEADCSIAMASGAEAARNVAHVVLLDSDFSSLPSVVAEGRRVINNISKASALFLMKTIFVMMLNIILLFPSAIPNLFENTERFYLLEWCIIAVPSVVLALQPNNEQIKGNFLGNMMSKALPGAVLYLIGTLAVYFYCIFIGDISKFTTLAAITVTLIGLFILYRTCRPFDKLRAGLFIGVSVFIVLVLTLVPWGLMDYMDKSKVELKDAFMVIILVQLSYNIYSMVTKGTDKLLDYFRRVREKSQQL
jgi:cation-transporting ATPase E